MDITPVLPGVWRWADPASSERCGTALSTAAGLVLVDPPALDGAARAGVSRTRRVRSPTSCSPAPTGPPGGPLPHRRGGHPDAGAGGRRRRPRLRSQGTPSPAGSPSASSRRTPPQGRWPCSGRTQGTACCSPGRASRWSGQVPVYLEGVAPPLPVYAGLVRALLAMEPGTLAPALQAPPAPAVDQATGYAGAHRVALPQPAGGPRRRPPLPRPAGRARARRDPGGPGRAAPSGGHGPLAGRPLRLRPLRPAHHPGRAHLRRAR